MVVLCYCSPREIRDFLLGSLAWCLVHQHVVSKCWKKERMNEWSYKYYCLPHSQVSRSCKGREEGFRARDFTLTKDGRLTQHIFIEYLVLVAQMSPTLWTPWTVGHQALVSMEFSRQEYGVDFHALLQRIFPTQGLNLGLLNYRRILYHLNHQGSPLTRCKGLYKV